MRTKNRLKLEIFVKKIEEKKQKKTKEVKNDSSNTSK